ncbi:histidine kinase [Nonomuraea sp. 3-1Str]|uniref:sensor histidine kinase n=1 Tax=Nonomuraea sp. 3-1Str TaxID=2929801 RepID=UPI002862520A|nr:histidine kinase [Nonomuraea sp. 3-1Str]MDR8409616.1 histidine kinase [Nonomuraea sp. 3-1Str]
MRQARLIVVVVLAGFAGVYVIAGFPGALAVFGVQVAYVLWRRCGWLLTAQAALVAGLSAGLGSSVAVIGFLGGALLLSRWGALTPLAGLGAAVIEHARHGEVRATLDATITTALLSLLIYGMGRLVDRAGELHANRAALAAGAAADERLRIAAELNDGLGRSLAVIVEGVRRALAGADMPAEVVRTARESLAMAREAAAGYRAMSLGPELTTARALLAAAGIGAEVREGHAEPLGPAGAVPAAVLREAVTDVVRLGAARTCLIETLDTDGTVRLRITDDGRRTAEDGRPGATAAQVEAAGGVLSAGLAPDGRYVVEAALPHRAAGEDEAETGRATYGESYGVVLGLLAAVLVGFSVKALLALPAGMVAPAAAVLAVVVAMQLRSVNGRHMVALGVMTVLAVAPVPVFGPVWLGVAGFVAGPVLLAFRWRVAWPLVAAVLAAVAVAGTAFGLPSAATANFTVSTLVTGLVVYGLVRLARQVKELQAAREELARAAVVEERLRAARDLHDLLGHSLAAILLKCELARRLDPARARAELTGVIALAEQAEADLRSVSGEHRDLSLASEAASARSVLSAAGVEVTVDLAHPPLPAEAETVLSAVLREAVTNVLRHSSARHCAVSTALEDGVVRLRVRNDGARGARARHGSSGIGNLTTRLAALDGRLTTAAGDGWFELEAVTPLLATPCPIPAA